MADFDIDILLIRLIKQKSDIKILDLITLLKDANNFLSENITEQFKQIDIFQNIISLDDDIPLKELKKILANIQENLFGSYLRASSVMMVNSIKEQFVDSENISSEEAKAVDELFGSLLEMQKLYNFLRHFIKALKVPDIAAQIKQSVTQEKIRQIMEEKSSKRISILDEIEDTQIKIIELKRERDKWINKILGKSKKLDFTIKELEQKTQHLRNQLKELV